MAEHACSSARRNILETRWTAHKCMGHSRKTSRIAERSCQLCRKPAAELSDDRRMCDVCHKRTNEARARPFILTSLRRRTIVDNEVNRHFDEVWLNKMVGKKAFDDARRRERQKAIAERKAKESEVLAVKTPDKVVLPKYTHKRIQAVKQALLEIFADNIGRKLTAAVLRETAYDCLAVLSLPKVDSNLAPMLEALQPYRAGLTAADGEWLAAFLAGNLLTLQSGIQPVRWEDGGPIGEWALITVEKVADGYVDHHGRPGYYASFLIHSGAMAGRKLVTGYSSGVEIRTARKLGISLKEAKFCKPKLLTGMLGFGYICLDFRDQPKVRAFASTAPQQKSNKDLLKNRIYPFGCKYSFRPDLMQCCTECPVGCKSKHWEEPRCRYALLPTTSSDHISEEMQAHVQEHHKQREQAWLQQIGDNK